jgi:ABC-type sugar transport system permease subunit
MIAEGLPTQRRLTWPTTAPSRVKLLLGVCLALLLLYLTATQPKVRTAELTVLIAVGASAGTWVLANLMLNQIRRRWTVYAAASWALVGFVTGVVIHGNRVTVGSTGGFWNFIWFPLAFAAVAAAGGLALARVRNPLRRIIAGVGGGTAVGAAIGLLVREPVDPLLNYGALLGCAAGGAGLAAALALALRRRIARPALFGAFVGSILGGWGAADLGIGNPAQAAVASALPLALLGGFVALGGSRNAARLAQMDRRARAVVFLAPSLLFIFITLVVPTIRTFWLSLKNRDSSGFVWFENYGSVFTDRESLDLSNWTSFFTSRLTMIGAALLLIAAVVAAQARRRTGRAVELGGPAVAPLLVGALLVSFGLFSTLRGTIINNLWWVVTVTVFSTGLGLAIAVLSDGVRFEKVAKSIIFMPMAISLVGASIIWRFMYATREASKPQTGVLNSLWVGLGRLSRGSGLPTLLVGAVLVGTFVAVAAGGARALARRQFGRAACFAAPSVLIGWFVVRYIGSGVGGFVVKNGRDVPQTIAFTSEGPFNNMWLMVILIWIQTGFAMVILSAAIKAVPSELIEAARMDGATKSQAFWRVVLPQVATTIGVVVTTLIVLVMKVFDIVKVVTNGNLGTQVLANNMYQEAFDFTNRGKGAALAVILFISVLPVMYLNIRRMQKEG